MNIDDLTLKQIKEINSLIGGNNTSNTLNSMIGKFVIVRTYSAGVHFGELSEKAGNEVILKNARRLYYWKTNGGISLSEVALTGLHDDSKVCSPVDIWLEAIEVIPCSLDSIASISEKKSYVA